MVAAGFQRAWTGFFLPRICKLFHKFVCNKKKITYSRPLPLFSFRFSRMRSGFRLPDKNGGKGISFPAVLSDSLTNQRANNIDLFDFAPEGGQAE